MRQLYNHSLPSIQVGDCTLELFAVKIFLLCICALQSLSDVYPEIDFGIYLGISNLSKKNCSVIINNFLVPETIIVPEIEADVDLYSI